MAGSRLPEGREIEFAVAQIDGHPRMVGSARYVVEPDGQNCEMAIVVNDDWHGQGIGQHLLDALTDTARRADLKTMHGVVLGTNAGMTKFAQRLGFEVDDVTRAPLKLIRKELEAT